MIAVGFEKYGSEEELRKDAIKHLFDVYVNINKDAESDPGVKTAAAAWFKRMEEGDEDALKNWRVWRELSVKKYEEEYDRLNVHFDVYTGESKVGKEWQDIALRRLDEMGLISDVDGAKLIDLEKWKLGKAVLRKKGAPVISHHLYAQVLTSGGHARRNIYIPNARHRRSDRALRTAQVRQDDLRHLFATGSAHGTVLQGAEPDGVPLGAEHRARQLWPRAWHEHA